MGLTTGIVGLPNVGKTTSFNALTESSAEASNYPFCTIDPNIGIVEVPDSRLDLLNELLSPKACTRNSIQFTDIAGLVKGASAGEGRGNEFLADVRDSDALIQVVRCFDDPAVVHVEKDIRPERDVDTIQSELMLADLQSVENALPHLERVVVTNPRSDRREEFDILMRIKSSLIESIPLNCQKEITEQDLQIVQSHNFLSAKPMLYVANIGEIDLEESAGIVTDLERKVGIDRVMPSWGQSEVEMLEFDKDERTAFLAELNLESFGIDRLILAAYRLLNLITFYTLANDKLQAWQLSGGSTAVCAAGKIHSDIQEGFIRAEVLSVDDLVSADGSIQRLRQEGRLRTEGRGYIVRDGDVMQFLFKN